MKHLICTILVLLSLACTLTINASEQNTNSASPVIKTMYSEKADLKYLLTLPKGYDAKSTEKDR
jgi:hypothetical protein